MRKNSGQETERGGWIIDWTDKGTVKREEPEWKRERDEVSSVRSHHTLADIALISGPREDRRVLWHTRTHTYTLQREHSHRHVGRFTVCLCADGAAFLQLFFGLGLKKHKSQTELLQNFTTYKNEDSLMWQVYVYVCISHMVIIYFCTFYTKTFLTSIQTFSSSALHYVQCVVKNSKLVWLRAKEQRKQQQQR